MLRMTKLGVSLTNAFHGGQRWSEGHRRTQPAGAGVIGVAVGYGYIAKPSDHCRSVVILIALQISSQDSQ